MRIAIVNPIRAFGGGEKWALNAARAMRSRGHEVTLLAHPRGELLRAAGEARVPASPLLLRNDVSPAGVLGLARELRKLRAQAFICCNERSVRLGVFAAPLAGGIPLVYRNGLQGCFKNKAHNRLLVAPRVSRFVVNAEATRQELLSFGWVPEARLRLIYNGVDPAPIDRADPTGLREELGAGPRDVVVLAAARIVPEKGHACLLSAVRELCARHPDASRRLKVWIAGEGPEAPRLRARIYTLGLHEQVRLLGFRSDVPRLLRAASVLCHPSEREGAPNIVLEAMAAGLPVAATRASGTSELVVHGETGLLSPVGDDRALAENLAAVLNDADLRRRLGAAGRERVVTEFTEERSAEQWLDLLAEVVESPRARSKQ